MTGHSRSLGPRWWSGAAQSFRLPLVLIGAATMAWSCTSGTPDSAAPTFDVMEKTIAELATALDADEITSRELIEQYLARMQWIGIDKNAENMGPGLADYLGIEEPAPAGG